MGHITEEQKTARLVSSEAQSPGIIGRLSQYTIKTQQKLGKPQTKPSNKDLELDKVI